MDQSIAGATMSEGFFFSDCVPPKFSQISIEDCDLQPKSFHDYAKSWGERPESVILQGDVGRGKTQFAFAMIREVFRRCPKRIWPRYHTSPDLDSRLLDAIKSEGGDKYLIETVGTEDLLFIDDFGRETNSERARRQYFEILNMRYVKMLPTIISTNLNLEQIANHMNSAIASRFQEYQIVEFSGPDLRPTRKISC
jgi:DNA replication protein DnaC